MIDIVDNIISKVASLYELAKQINHQKLIQEIANLQRDLIDMQFSHNSLRYENFKLQREVENLENLVAERLVFHKSAYYLDGSEDAFCVGCLDGDRKVIRLVPTTGTDPAKIYKCPRCKNTYRLH